MNTFLLIFEFLFILICFVIIKPEDFTWDSVTENGSNLLDSKMRLLRITDKLTTSFVEAKRTIIVKRKYASISSISYYYDEK